MTQPSRRIAPDLEACPDNVVTMSGAAPSEWAPLALFLRLTTLFSGIFDVLLIKAKGTGGSQIALWSPG